MKCKFPAPFLLFSLRLSLFTLQFISAQLLLRRMRAMEVLPTKVAETMESPLKRAISGQGLMKNPRMFLGRQDGISEIQHPTTMEHLPGDLLSYIFICLLAKQLAQMRCVSKSWNALLSQSSFIKSHLHRSINNNDRILLAFFEASDFDPEPLAAFPCRSPDLELTNFIKLPPVNPNSGHTTSMIEVIGSVHGLICSCYGDDVIHIWNPSLSAVSTLPPYSVPSHLDHKISFRFGFDPTTKDYKIVKVTGVRRSPMPLSLDHLSPFNKEWLQVEVYSMRKGSWEFITQRVPSHVTMIFNSDHVCVDGHDGHLHWLGYIDEDLPRQTIVTFDLGSETFREIPLPDAILGNNRANLFGVLSGKFCVMSRVVPDGVYEVWEMDEYGVVESWAIRHVFSKFVDGVVSFGFTSHNEFLFEDDNGFLSSCDLIGHNAKILKSLRRREYDLEKIVEYVDSLVWLVPAKPEIMDGVGQN